MSVSLCFDVHVPLDLAEQLRARGVDVLRAQDDGRSISTDEDLLARATALGRVLDTQDEDLLAIAANWIDRNATFAGLVYVHQNRLSLGQRVRDLHLVSECYDPEDMKNRIEFLPL